MSSSQADNLLIYQLQSILRQPLPGHRAHLFMAPPGRQVLPYRPYDAKIAAVTVLIHRSNGIVLVCRAQNPRHRDVHAGQIALPGGRKDPTDPSLKATALREIYEEIGIPPSHIHLIGHLTPVYIPVSRYWVLPFVAATEHSYSANSPEVASTFNLPLKTLHSSLIPIRYPLYLPSIDRTIDVPCYRYRQHIIWGATAMILREFQMILRQLPPQSLP